jgi:hypothetical protein
MLKLFLTETQKPLSAPVSLALMERLIFPETQRKFGQKIVALARGVGAMTAIFSVPVAGQSRISRFT